MSPCYWTHFFFRLNHLTINHMTRPNTIRSPNATMKPAPHASAIDANTIATDSKIVSNIDNVIILVSSFNNSFHKRNCIFREREKNSQGYLSRPYEFSNFSFSSLSSFSISFTKAVPATIMMPAANVLRLMIILLSCLKSSFVSS